MTAEEYKAHCKVRTYLRAKVTRLNNKITDIIAGDVSKLSTRDKNSLIDDFKKVKFDIDTANQSVHSVIPDDVDLQKLMDDEEHYDNTIRDCLGVLCSIPQDALPPPSTHNKLKLPDVELPIFSNDKSDNLEKFFYAFESIINKHALSEYEKFIYLKGQVRKGPEALINSLEASNQTYKSAKKLLMDAFASPLSQKYSAIKKLSELKLSAGDDVYSFIGGMRSITSSFTNLGIGVDDILQYFIWNSFNRKFQDQMIQITNVTKPSLKQINDNIFSASERYLKLADLQNEKSYKKTNPSHYHPIEEQKIPITNNLAVNVKSKTGRVCVLCRSDGIQNIDHTLRDCKSYAKPEEKVTKLNSLRFCSKCSFINHTSSQCKFKFSSPCRFCKKPHMSYLCTKAGTDSVFSNVACVHFYNANVRDDNNLLPTFSVDVSSNNRSVTCRILSDTGCQRNFVHEKVVLDLNLPTIRDNVDLRIHGFNAKKRIKTKIVTVPILINEVTHNIKAIVVPSIDITLECTHMNSISKDFRKKGYLLADRQLGDSDTVSDFDLVMGPDSVRLLCLQTVLFGKPVGSSAYLQTEIGVMLLGDTEDMYADLEFLPYCELPHTSENVVDTNVQSNVVDEILTDAGDINIAKLNVATKDALEALSNSYLDYDVQTDHETDILNEEIVHYILSNTDRDSDGRLIMDLPWNPKCKHQLASNVNLSRKILQSNFRKLQKDNKLAAYNKVFMEQEELGIIERIEDIQTFIHSHPDHSFLPHMGVFRPGHESTKCRVVFLSNLCEKREGESVVSHNNALLPGPCLNTKLSISLLLSRFDKFVLVFDITKAFLGIKLRESDQNRLLFWWYKNVDEGDFSLIIYRNLRLPFGLRPSPSILMLALYKIMMIDVDNDCEDTITLKRQIYNNIYMDNGLVSSNDLDLLNSYYHKLILIFNDYQFHLQQFATNNPDFQSKIDRNQETFTENSQKYFGMKWNRELDTLGPFPISLDIKACTKREVLSSLNSVYDLFNVCSPILNRAKLYLHKLQCEYKLDWDSKLNPELLTEWMNICKQCNSAPTFEINRFIGSRDSSYTLVAFSDSSALLPKLSLTYIMNYVVIRLCHLLTLLN